MEPRPSQPAIAPKSSRSHSVIRRAVIDIGTNSIKLLVADVRGDNVVAISEDSTQTRLGQGFFESRLLRADAIEATAKAAQMFAIEARALEAAEIRVIATSAARDALNAAELIDAIKASSGLKVEIISGEIEAEWAFRGVASDPKFLDQSLVIIDVGGGSTEVILGRGAKQLFRNSYRMGTVRLLEKIQPEDPPTLKTRQFCRVLLKEFFEQTIRPEVAPVLPSLGPDPRLVGTGGTTTILARVEKQLTSFNREAIEGTRLGANRLKEHIDRLWSVCLEERKKIIGLPPKRADVILTGTMIYESLLEGLGMDELQVSTRGLRYAAVM